MNLIEDRTDTKLAIAQHFPDGEHYVVRYCSLWNDQECVGSRIIESVGPLHYSDLNLDSWASAAAINNLPMMTQDWEFTDENAEWLQAEEDAARLLYPYGGT